MQTHELPPVASMLDQYVQHFAGTIAPRVPTPAREALRRVNCELSAIRATLPRRPRIRLRLGDLAAQPAPHAAAHLGTR